ncbi:hypothetical protein [Sedimentibacter sp.]|uniref:hypothetical protein n=1 Tax=Sedimentibacter sp. TaxID=1960295 RepID=UPI00289BE6EC|nr:hypothetical protein [Sedimentibacter sp.]
MKNYISLICVILTVILLSAVLTACMVENEPFGKEPAIGGGLRTEAVIFDFSYGSPEENLYWNTLYDYEDISVKQIIDGLSDWSGLDFSVEISYDDEGGVIIDWASDSSLISGSIPENQKVRLSGYPQEHNEKFNWQDADSLRWFMMDSMYQTLQNKNYTVYYTMDGGKELAFDELYPANVFPSDIPYMGSAFYFNHADGRGESIQGFDKPEWQGDYTAVAYVIKIYNFDGTGFNFEAYKLDAPARVVAGGYAALYPDNELMAEYGQMSFSLHEDYSALDIFTPEDHDLSGLRGYYEKNEVFNFSLLSDWEFVFSSGAGGWATIVQIGPDGTFSGSFHDSEMGATGDDYPDGTIYVCDFTGEFKSVEKIDDYEYSMKCENLMQEGIDGEEEIINGIKYIISTPYGFDDAGEFRLYLPGKKVSELPSEYVEWIYGLEESDVLEFYGLYNFGGKQGFSSYNLEGDSIN